MDEQNTGDADQAEQAVEQEQGEQETGQEAKPYTQKQKAVVALLLLTIVGAGWSILQSARARLAKTAPVTTLEGDMCAGPGQQAADLPEAVGAPEAKIRIEACMGQCISGGMQQIADVASAWPDQIRAEFYTFESTEGQQFVSEHNETVACVFVNGENAFTITKDAEEKKVVFSGPPGADYEIADLAAVLRMKFEEVYGSVPPDFDEKVQPLLVDGSSSCGTSPCGTTTSCATDSK